MKVYVKRVTDKEFQPGDARYLFETELICLKLLKGCKHFPQLIEADEEKLIITMTHCGETLQYIKGKLFIPDLHKQVNAIINTLKEKGIYHLDLPIMNGQNICIKDGVIHLIDFGAVYFKNRDNTEGVKERMNHKSRGAGSWDNLKKIILSAILNVNKYNNKCFIKTA